MKYRPYKTVREVPVGSVILRKDREMKAIISGAYMAGSELRISVGPQNNMACSPDWIMENYELNTFFDKDRVLGVKE